MLRVNKRMPSARGRLLTAYIHTYIHRRASKYHRSRAVGQIHFLITIPYEVKRNARSLATVRIRNKRRDDGEKNATRDSCTRFEFRAKKAGGAEEIPARGVERLLTGNREAKEWRSEERFLSAKKQTQRFQTFRIRGTTGSSACETQQDVCRAISYARLDRPSIPDRTVSLALLISHGV